ncbi:hypothetical protein D9C73_002278 [Collichthys lucidus]|uniref:Uncharacterized protein n=1 Tax=Collichthys lucidus TaxID=240159 RepID=A0A4U5U295_COLLU|nr:hypothetical protein D9C73_002278 [Collichthys lucidus]
MGSRNKLQTEKQQRARPSVLPPLLSRGGATQAANQKLNAETPAPLSPEVGQPQPGVPQQPAPQGGPQFLPPTQYYVWSTLGGSPMIMPLQPNMHGSLPAFPQQPLNPQIVYMLQQPMSAALGSLSSEELQMAATMGQLGVYLPRVLTNPSTVAVQPVNQANGLTNPEQQGTVQTVDQAAGLANRVQQDIVPTVGAASAGVQQTPELASSGPQPNTNAIPPQMYMEFDIRHAPAEAAQAIPAGVPFDKLDVILPVDAQKHLVAGPVQGFIKQEIPQPNGRESKDVSFFHYLPHYAGSRTQGPSQMKNPFTAGQALPGIPGAYSVELIYPHRFPGAGGSNPAQPFPSHGFIKYSIPQPPGRQSVEVYYPYDFSQQRIMTNMPPMTNVPQMPNVLPFDYPQQNIPQQIPNIPSFDANPIPSQDPLQPLQQDQPAQTSQVPGSESNEEKVAAHANEALRWMEMYRMYQQQGVVRNPFLPAADAPVDAAPAQPADVPAPAPIANEDASEEEAEEGNPAPRAAAAPGAPAAPLNSDEAEEVEEVEAVEAEPAVVEAAPAEPAAEEPAAAEPAAADPAAAVEPAVVDVPVDAAPVDAVVVDVPPVDVVPVDVAPEAPVDAAAADVPADADAGAPVAADPVAL